jgi:phage tail sheath gpL-like
MSGTNENSTGGAILPFLEIPAYQLRPGDFVEIQPNYNNIGLLPYPARILLIAQTLGAGSGIAWKPTQVIRQTDGAALCGAGSMADQMVWAQFAAQQSIPVDLLAAPDAAEAVKATGTITIAGSWTQGGTFPAEIAGVYMGAGFLGSDTPTSVAADLAAAINAYGLPQGPQLPVTATSAAGVVTITAVQGGLCGNDIRLEVGALAGDGLVQGMTATVVQMHGGATNPSIATAISAINNILYSAIVCPWQDEANLQALAAELERRYGAMVRLDCTGYSVFTGNFSAIQATKAYVNEKCLAVLGVTNPPTVPWAIASSLAGVAEFNLTNDPARQLRGLALPGIIGSRATDQFDDEERELMLEDGVGTFTELIDGTIVLERVVSTYLTNSEGVPDPAWLDIMAGKVMTRIRYDWRTYYGLRYPRNKLAPDGSIAAQADPTVVTPNRMKGSWTARCRLYEENGWLTDMTTGLMLARQSVFLIDPNNKNRLLSTRPMNIIGNLITSADIFTFNA